MNINIFRRLSNLKSTTAVYEVLINIVLIVSLVFMLLIAISYY